jgi:hypothetical protein
MEEHMKVENRNRKIAEQSPITWAGILAGAAFLVVSLGALIYFFVISN